MPNQAPKITKLLTLIILAPFPIIRGFVNNLTIVNYLNFWSLLKIFTGTLFGTYLELCDIDIDKGLLKNVNINNRLLKNNDIDEEIKENSDIKKRTLKEFVKILYR